MLDIAVKFLVTELNAFLTARGAVDSTGSGSAALTRIVTDSGAWDVPTNQVGVALVNLEEERTTRPQLPKSVYTDGGHVLLEPELKVNLYLLFAANFQNYEAGLRQLSHVLTFFQARPLFTRERYPALDERIERLGVDLLSLTFEQLNQLWGFVGTKQLPSVVYRARLIILQDLEPVAIHPPITEVNAEVELL